jgi:hypothetical protein
MQRGSDLEIATTTEEMARRNSARVLEVRITGRPSGKPLQ